MHFGIWCCFWRQIDISMENDAAQSWLSFLVKVTLANHDAQHDAAHPDADMRNIYNIYRM